MLAPVSSSTNISRSFGDHLTSRSWVTPTATCSAHSTQALTVRFTRPACHIAGVALAMAFHLRTRIAPGRPAFSFGIGARRAQGCGPRKGRSPASMDPRNTGIIGNSPGLMNSIAAVPLAMFEIWGWGIRAFTDLRFRFICSWLDAAPQTSLRGLRHARQSSSLCPS
jgi:hypothetical protein